MIDTVICRCEEVLLSEVLKFIEGGEETTKELKLKTRAGMGICQARTCRPLLEQVISFHTKKAIPISSGLTYTHPIRPLTIAELACYRKES